MLVNVFLFSPIYFLFMSFICGVCREVFFLSLQVCYIYYHIVIFLYAWIRLKLFICHDFKLDFFFFFSYFSFYLSVLFSFYEASDQYVKCERTLTHMQIGPLNGNLRPPSPLHFSFCLFINLSIYFSDCLAPRSPPFTRYSYMLYVFCGASVVMIMNSQKACESFGFLCVCKLYVFIPSPLSCLCINLPPRDGLYMYFFHDTYVTVRPSLL